MPRLPSRFFLRASWRRIFAIHSREYMVPRHLRRAAVAGGGIVVVVEVVVPEEFFAGGNVADGEDPDPAFDLIDFAVGIAGMI